MAKPKDQMRRVALDGTRVNWEKIGGYCTTCGFKMQPDGKRRGDKFYFGHDLTIEQAAFKKRAIHSMWKSLKQQGAKIWSEEAYQDLYYAGIIRREKHDRMTNDDAIKRFPEPLNDKQLVTFLDPETGKVQPALAVKALEADALNVISGAEFRSNFHKQVTLESRRDPWGTIIRIKQTFDLSPERSQLLVQQIFQGVQSPQLIDDSELIPDAPFIDLKVKEGMLIK